MLHINYFFIQGLQIPSRRQLPLQGQTRSWKRSGAWGDIGCAVCQSASPAPDPFGSTSPGMCHISKGLSAQFIGIRASKCSGLTRTGLQILDMRRNSTGWDSALARLSLRVLQGSGPLPVFLLRMVLTSEVILRTTLPVFLPSSLIQEQSPQASLFPPTLCLLMLSPIQVLRFLFHEVTLLYT